MLSTLRPPSCSPDGERLVVKVPTEAEAEDTLVEWIVGDEIIVVVAHALVEVAHHDEEACLFQMEIGIDVHEWVAAYLGNG